MNFANAVISGTQPSPAPSGRQFLDGSLPPVRLERGVNPNYNQSYSEYLDSVTLQVVIRNSNDRRFSDHYNRSSSQLAGVDFPEFYAPILSAYLMKHRIHMVRSRFLPSGDVVVILNSFLDWMKFIFNTPPFVTFRFPGPNGASILVEATRNSPYPIDLLKFELKGCSNRIDCEDVHLFLESNHLKHPLSNGQFAIRYKMLGPVWTGDYIVYAHTPLKLQEIFSSTHLVHLPDIGGGKFHTINDIVLFLTPRERAVAKAAAEEAAASSATGQEETKSTDQNPLVYNSAPIQSQQATFHPSSVPAAPLSATADTQVAVSIALPTDLNSPAVNTAAASSDSSSELNELPSSSTTRNKRHKLLRRNGKSPRRIPTNGAPPPPKNITPSASKLQKYGGISRRTDGVDLGGGETLYPIFASKSPSPMPSTRQASHPCSGSDDDDPASN